MTRMHNPSHPGEVLREYLGETTVTAAAVKLGINRVTLNRIVTGVSGISADMDIHSAKTYGRKASDFGLPGRSGVIRSNFDNPLEKRAARRHWKRVDRAAGKRACSVAE